MRHDSRFAIDDLRIIPGLKSGDRVSTFRRFDLSILPRAYTLIELLIVVAVLGISSALLIPHLVNRDSMNVQAAVRLIIGDLSFAQTDALAHQELRRVHFYDDGRGYCIVRIDDPFIGFDEETADYIHDPLQGGANYIVNFLTDNRFNGVSIGEVDIDGGGRDLQFDQIGGTMTTSGTPGTGGTVVVRSGDDAYQITISPFTGKLRVVKL